MHFLQRCLLTGVAICSMGCAPALRSWQDWSKQKSAHVAAASAMPLAAPDLASFRPALNYHIGDGARVGERYDLSMRNPDFPRTHIALIDVDLNDPHHSLRLTWTGPLASQGPTGPFASTSGQGAPGCDCNDVATSNQVDSRCTPKGVFRVAAFADHLTLAPYCEYATWVLHAPRFIAIHSHFNVPRAPSSSGCIRANPPVAKLIHNNSLVGETIIHIHGQWKRSEETLNQD